MVNPLLGFFFWKLPRPSWFGLDKFCIKAEVSDETGVSATYTTNLQRLPLLFVKKNHIVQCSAFSAFFCAPSSAPPPQLSHTHTHTHRYV